MANSIMDFIEENYQELLLFSIRMNGNWEDAQDVLQTVAANICVRQNELKNLAHCKAYLMVCLRNATLNLKRTKQRQRTVGTEFEQLGELLCDPASEQAFAYLDWIASLEQHLRRYDEPTRKAFIAYYVDQAPLEEVAASLNLTKRQTTKKFESMRAYLKRHYKHLFVQLCILLSL